jgi:hypothetical protein
MSEPGHQHWVLIETGGNQGYVFGSNRLRHVVGGSQVVHEVGNQWVPEAVDSAGLPRESVVMRASGKALLLVDSEDVGRRVIRAVTRRALDDAPGLQVTGAVGPGFDPAVPHRVGEPSADDHVGALTATQRLHAEVRAARPSPLLRDRLFPWHEPCRESGPPTARYELYGDDPNDDGAWHPASAAVAVRSCAGARARTRLEKILGERADVVPKNLDELRHDGWIAVLHADGNGVGRLFLNFARHIAAAEGQSEVSLDLHVRYQGEIADQLNKATEGAVQAALAEALDKLGWSTEQRQGTFLPIVVGGDDVTVACHAALALPFVRHFAEAFAKQSAAQPTLSKLVGAAQAGGLQAAGASAELTASAGIAVVKPHHPFSAAYELAESLTASAKRIAPDADGPALPSLPAMDVHVAHESTLRPLADLRRNVVLADPEPSEGCEQRVARHGGPYLLLEDDDPRLEKYPPQDAERLRQRGIRHLEEVLEWLGPDGWLSSARAHGLRGALDRGLPEYRQQIRLAVARARAEGTRTEGDRTVPGDADGRRFRQLLDVQGTGDRRFLRLLDAMLLHGLTNRTDDEAAEAAGTQAR